MKPDLSPAQALLDAGFHLVKLHQNSKAPVGDSWNTPANYAKSIDETATGYGMPLQANGLVSLDPDNVDLAKRGLAGCGFDLEPLMQAGVRTRSTRSGSGGRSAFADPGDLRKIVLRTKESGIILELRAGGSQDVVPGLTYMTKTGEICTQAYCDPSETFLDAKERALPADLLTWWRRLCDDPVFKLEQENLFAQAIGEPPMHDYSGHSELAFPSPCRGAFNRENNVEDILEKHGYERVKGVRRFKCPGATGSPGVRPIQGRDGLWRSDHGSDPLHGTFDCWQAFVLLEHDGDLSAAEAAAGVVASLSDFEVLPFDPHAERRERQRREDAEVGRGQHDPLVRAMGLREMQERFIFLSHGSFVFDRHYPKHSMSLADFKNLTKASKIVVNSLSSDKMITKAAADVWLESADRQTAHSRTFKAGAGLFTHDPGGSSCVNTWQGFNRLTEPDGQTADVFVDHVRWLFGDRADDFLDWLAHIEQCPGELPHTHWLHVSEVTGSGRGWLGGILARVFDGHVACGLDLMTALDSGFNQALANKILATTDEIRQGASGQRWKHAERLKEMLTQEHREINEKYGRKTVEFNSCRFLMFSNHYDAIPIDQSDRRIEVVAFTGKPKDEAYYTKIYALRADKGFIAAVALFLGQRDISHFNPGRHSKQTEARSQVIARGLSQDAQAILEVSQTYPNELVTFRELKAWAGYSRPHDKLTGTQLAAFTHSVEDAGWRKIGKKWWTRSGESTQEVEVIYAKADVASRWRLEGLRNFRKELPKNLGGEADTFYFDGIVDPMFG